MYISKLVLRNFKSYKNATIVFSPGFTAIVGPNGSGKSNIVDAICFVLGKSSSKSLRAERFSDVIFSSDKKTEKEAEVTIYFDNSDRRIPIDSDIVKISRRINIKGQSTFKLNDKTVSKKEILDKLLLAGIDPNGYNIVFQGDVTRIIEMSPKERKKIIEDIAGISEYEEKKKKAIEELSKVEENLKTIEAVLNEVEIQLKRLKKEKDDAIRYRMIKDEIKRKKALVLHSKRLEINEKISEINEKERNLLNNVGKAEKYLKILKEKIKEKKKLLEEIEVDEKKNEFIEIFKEKEKIKSNLGIIENKIDDINNKIIENKVKKSEYKEEIKKLYKETKEIEKKINILENEVSQINSKISLLKREIEKKYSKIMDGDEAVKLGERIDHLRSIILKKEKEILSLKNNYTSIESLIKSLKEDIENEEKELESKQKELKTYKRNLDILRKTLEKYIESDESAEVKKLESLEKHLIEKLNNLVAEYSRIEGKISVVAESDKIMNIIRDIDGVYGRIGELFTVDDIFATAIEVAMGRGIDFIVVENEDVAKKCIERLREKKAGRATFLPLNKIKIKLPSLEEERIASENYGFAIDLIDFDEKFRKAFYYVLRNTVVVENLDVAKKYINKARIVTLDGDLVEIGGAITGGYYKSRSSGLKLKSKLVELEIEIKKIRRELEKISLRKKNLIDEIERKRNRKADIEKEIENLTSKIEYLTKDLEKLENGLKEKKEKLKNLEKEKNTIEEMISKTEKDFAPMKREIEILSRKKKEIESVLSGSGINEIKKLENELRKLEKIKNEKKALIEIHKNKLQILKKRFYELKTSLVNVHRITKSYEKEMNELIKEKTVLENRYRKILEEESRLKDEMIKFEKRKEKIINAVKKLNEKITKINWKKEYLKKDLEKIKIEKARLEIKLENILNQLKEYEDVEIDLIAPINTKEIEEEIKALEEEIQNMKVNMNAIEEYRKTKERYDEIKKKYDKLVEEKKSIEEVIEELENKKITVFNDTLSAIDQNFREIYKKLGEGDAQLIVNEDGLYIRARPKNKSTKSLELMSGGEKTLTALAFIFAIQRYMPAPFYIFDEIDMFLDDNNVKKVSELIKESSKDAQFIVVSLKKKMASSADALYGVSNEKGISKVVSLNLEVLAHAR